MIPVGIMICSYSIDLDEKKMEKLLFGYCLSVTLLAVSSVLYYAGNFSIQQIYVIPAKNQLGPMLGIVLVILGRNILNGKNFGLWTRLFCLIMFFLDLASLLVLRNRSGIVSGFVVIFLYFIFNSRVKLTKINLLLLLIVLIVLFGILSSEIGDFAIKFVWESLTLNYDVTDIESLSSGRVVKYVEAIEFAQKNYISGNLTESIFEFKGNPHNYILFNWVKYGIVFSFPLVLFYIYLYCFVFKNIVLTRSKYHENLAIWILMFSLLVSNFEYSYPYGPGVSQLMLWILLGKYLRNYHKNMN